MIEAQSNWKISFQFFIFQSMLDLFVQPLSLQVGIQGPQSDFTRSHVRLQVCRTRLEIHHPAVSESLWIVLRSQGNYFIAFLVPAILMAVALILFLLGSKYYTKNMPTGNIFAQFLGATWAALRGKCKGMVSNFEIQSKIQTQETFFSPAIIEIIISLQKW